MNSDDILQKIKDNTAILVAVRREIEEMLQKRDRLIWQASRANTPRARVMEASGLGKRAVGVVLEKDPDRDWYSGRKQP